MTHHADCAAKHAYRQIIDYHKCEAGELIEMRVTSSAHDLDPPGFTLAIPDLFAEP